MYTSLATAIRSALGGVVDAAVNAMQNTVQAAQQHAVPANDGAVQQRADDIVSGMLRGVLESLGPALVQRLGVTIQQPDGTTVGAQAPPGPAAPGQPPLVSTPSAPPSVQSFPLGGDETDEEDVKEPADKRHKPVHAASDAVQAPPPAPIETVDVPMTAPPADVSINPTDVAAASVSAPAKPAPAGPSGLGPSGLGPKGGLGKGLALPPKRPAKRNTENSTDAARAGVGHKIAYVNKSFLVYACNPAGMAAVSAAANSNTTPAPAAPEPASTQLGPSAAAAPPLGDLLGSLMGALNGPPGEGGQGGLDGLMQMAAQVASSPAMANVAQQLAGGDARQLGGGAPPNIGSLMQSMMPLMQEVLGGGGRGGARRNSRVVDMAQVGQQLAAILGDQAAREWIQRMETDVEAMAAADPAPLSDTYQLTGGGPSSS